MFKIVDVFRRAGLLFVLANHSHELNMTHFLIVINDFPLSISSAYIYFLFIFLFSRCSYPIRNVLFSHKSIVMPVFILNLFSTLYFRWVLKVRVYFPLLFISFYIHLLKIFEFFFRSRYQFIDLFIIGNVFTFILIIFISFQNHFDFLSSFVLRRFLVVHSSLNNHLI